MFERNVRARSEIEAPAWTHIEHRLALRYFFLLSQETAAVITVATTTRAHVSDSSDVVAVRSRNCTCVATTTSSDMELRDVQKTRTVIQRRVGRNDGKNDAEYRNEDILRAARLDDRRQHVAECVCGLK